jgi:hypothetical protein
MDRRAAIFIAALCSATLLATTEIAAAGSEGTDGAKPFSRFCKAQDVVGTWKLVKYSSQFEFKNPNAPFLMPHQVFHFSDRGSMKSAFSAKPFAGDTKKVFQQVPDEVTYAFEREGMMTVKAKSAPANQETWHCVAITADKKDEVHQAVMKKGDVVMTLVGKNGQPVFVRQLRK